VRRIGFSRARKQFRQSAVAFRLVLLCDRIVTPRGAGLKGGQWVAGVCVKGWSLTEETSQPRRRYLARRSAMSKFQQKVEAQTRQIIGQMLGDQLLVEEGKEQERQATEPGRDHHDHSGQEYETKAAKK
jgi:hypothetical protein